VQCHQAGFEAVVWEGMVGGQPHIGTVLKQELGKLHITPVRHPSVCQWWMRMVSTWTIVEVAAVPTRADRSGQEG